MKQTPIQQYKCNQGKQTEFINQRQFSCLHALVVKRIKAVTKQILVVPETRTGRNDYLVELRSCPNFLEFRKSRTKAGGVFFNAGVLFRAYLIHGGRGGDFLLC